VFDGVGGNARGKSHQGTKNNCDKCGGDGADKCSGACEQQKINAKIQNSFGPMNEESKSNPFVMIYQWIAQLIDPKFPDRPDWEKAEVVGSISGFLQKLMFETIPEVSTAFGWLKSDAEGKADVSARSTVDLQSLPMRGEFEEAIGRISQGYNNILSKCTKYQVAHGGNNIYNEDNGLLGGISGQAISSNGAPAPPEYLDHGVFMQLLDPGNWGMDKLADASPVAAASMAVWNLAREGANMAIETKQKIEEMNVVNDGHILGAEGTEFRAEKSGYNMFQQASAKEYGKVQRGKFINGGIQMAGNLGGTYWHSGCRPRAAVAKNMPSTLDEFLKGFDDNDVTTMWDTDGDVAGSFYGGSNGHGEVKYLTFMGAGSVMEFEHSLDSKTEGTEYGWTYSVGGSMTRGAEAEVTIAVFTKVVESTENAFSKTATFDVSIGHNVAWNKHGSMGVHYALGDDTPADKFIIRIHDDIRFGTPVFEVAGGYSMCPGEPGTIWRESGLQLRIINWVGIDNSRLLPGQTAMFNAQISLKNVLREPLDLNMQTTSTDEQTGAKGSVILFNGDILNGDNKEFGGFSAMIEHNFVLQLTQPELARSIEGFGIEIRSSCEAAFGSNIYRDPLSSGSFQIPKATWLMECPPVEFNPIEHNTLVYKTNDPKATLKLVVYNPDVRNRWDVSKKDDNQQDYKNGALEKVQVQIRPVPNGQSPGEWNTVLNGTDGNPHDFKCTGDTTSGCSLDWSIAQQTYTMWDMSMNKEVTRKITDIEGEFELRARTLCNGRVPNAPISLMSQYSTENIIYKIDVTPPFAHKVSQPELGAANGNIVAGSVVFSEGVNCAKLTLSAVTSTGCGGGGGSSDATGVEFVCKTGSETLLIKVPKGSKKYKIVISGIEDDFQNKLVGGGDLTVTMNAGCAAASLTAGLGASSSSSAPLGDVASNTAEVVAQMQRTTEDGAAHSANALREVAAKIDELVAEQRHLTREVAESHNNKVAAAEEHNASEMIERSVLGAAQHQQQTTTSFGGFGNLGDLYSNHRAAAAYAGAASAILVAVAVVAHLMKKKGSRKHTAATTLLGTSSRAHHTATYGSRV